MPTNLQSPGTTWAGLYGPTALINTNGTALTNYTPTINTTTDGSTSSGTPTFYTDWTRSTTTSAPQTDSYGNLKFWVDPGLYLLTYTLPGSSQQTIQITVPPFYPDATWNVPTPQDSSGSNLLVSGDSRMVNAVAGSITETLPAPTHAGSRIKVTKTDNSTNAVFITTANSSVIYGPGLGNSFAAQSTMTLFGQGASMEFFSDGTNWHTTGTAIRRVGCIDMYGGSTAPPGALLCNYAAISRTTYADLFAVIGTTYGYGDNSTTFNVPDFRSVSPIGAGTGTHTGTTARTLGAFVGAETHTITAAELPPHTHTNPNPQYMVGSAATSTIYTNQGANIDHSPAYNLSATPSTGTTTTAQTVATPTVTPTLVVNFIIWAQ